jgi:hypothetical protein
MRLRRYMRAIVQPQEYLTNELRFSVSREVISLRTFVGISGSEMARRSAKARVADRPGEMSHCSIHTAGNAGESDPTFDESNRDGPRNARRKRSPR